MNYVHPLKLSEDEIYDALKEYYETGLPLREIGRKYGVSGSTLSRYIKMSPAYSELFSSSNAKFRPHPRLGLTAETVALIRHDRIECGMTFREIAEKYDVSITTAYACTSDHRTYAPTEKIPMELIPEMVMEYRKGDLSLEAIAILYGLPNGGNSLIRYMKKEGISRKGHDTARLTEEKIRAVVDDYYNSDMTIGEVAEKHGVSARSVSKYAKEAKEADPSLKRLSEKKRRTPGDLDAIVEEFRTTGITMADLSAKHGIKESVIRAHVADMGLDYEELKKENAELRVPKAHDYDNHRLSEDRIRAIAEDYNNLNLTVRDLARKHGVSCFTVNKYAKAVR